MAKKTFETCRNAGDFLKLAERKGATVCTGNGSHRKISTTRGTVVIPCHGEGREICRNLRKKIVKQLMAIGLTIILVGLVVLSAI